MNSLSHFSFYLHLSVIAIKLSLQTFILPQIKSWNIIGLKLTVSNHIISCWLLTWIQLIFPLRTHPHDCWPNIKSINTHVSISHKIKVLKYWQKLILLLFILLKSIYLKNYIQEILNFGVGIHMATKNIIIVCTV